MKRKKLLQTDGCGVNFLGFGRADWENYFSFFFHFPHYFSWKARFSTESKKERKKDRGRRPYYLLTYNSTSNDSDSFKKQQKVC